MPDQHSRSYAERFETAFNEGTSTAMGQLFAPDMVDHAPWPGHSADVAGFQSGLAEMRASFPDLHLRVERTVAEGDMMAVHCRISGTQLGEFMGAPPSNRSFEIEAIDIVRLDDGRIAEHWGVLDAAAMAEQLGL